MKRYFYCLSMAVVAWMCMGCEKTGETTGSTKSLSIETTELIFEARGAEAREVTVTAENLEWSFDVSETASEWLHTERNGDVLVVSVDDNHSPEERRGSITVVPEDAGPIKSKIISVVQQASDEKYSLTVHPEKLDFAALDAEPQTVEIITEGTGLTWHSEIEESAREWLAVEEGDGSITVSVQNTSQAPPRVGSIVIVSNMESVMEKTIRVEQAGLPPSLSVNVESIEFSYKETTYKNIVVTAVNTEWSVKAVDEEGVEVTWLKAQKAGSMVRVEPTSVNATLEPRQAYVVITPDAEELEPVRVLVTQTAANEILTTLTDDLDLGMLAGARAVFSPSQVWDQTTTVSSWDLYLWEEGVTFDKKTFLFKGTGGRLVFKLFTEKITFNDDNEYYIPDGTYTVTALAEGEAYAPGQLQYPEVWTAGHPRLPLGAWYTKLENDAYTTDQAPLVVGTLTVTRNGENYEFGLNFEDDLGFKVTGTYSGALDLMISGAPRPEPTVE